MNLGLQKSVYSSLTESQRILIIKIFFGLKNQKPKIRLALVNMNGFLSGQLGWDSFIGLEIEANKALELQAKIM